MTIQKIGINLHITLINRKHFLRNLRKRIVEHAIKHNDYSHLKSRKLDYYLIKYNKEICITNIYIYI